MKRFWNWIKNSEGSRSLFIEGPIADESWWGDEVTPAMFREELTAGSGNISVYINSPGGDCFAASQIYTMLMEYPHEVNVIIEGLAASAASVIAMAGTTVKMAPTAMLMIHNPATVAYGQVTEMQEAINVLNEVKESIINAYQIKTGMSRNRISRLMDEETWMNARKALELGFCDVIMSREDVDETDDVIPFAFGQRVVEACIAKALTEHYQPKEAVVENKVEEPQDSVVEVEEAQPEAVEPETVTEDAVEPTQEVEHRVDASEYDKRLQCLKYV